MVIFVTGSKGQLGSALHAIASKYPDFYFKFFDSTELNLLDSVKIEQLFDKFRPDFCINTAAYTAVDKAESESDLAFKINEKGVENLATICRHFQTTLIHISTDYVFDGQQSKPYTETDIPAPQSVYGASKRAGEVSIERILTNYYIIRTAWVYSDLGNNFYKTMLRLAETKSTLQVVNDQIGSPTNAYDLAEACLKLIHKKSIPYGIYHYSAEGACSWYDFAKKIFEIHDCEIEVVPIPTSAYPTPAKRPHYSLLDKTKFKSLVGSVLHWEETLKTFILKNKGL